MPLTCTICKHADRTAIEAQLIRRTTLREIAQQFRGTTSSALHRHKHNCLGAALVKAKERRELDSGSKALIEIEAIAAKIAQLYDTALQFIQESRDAQDRRQALLAMDRAILLLREARANAGLVASLTGEMNQAGNKGGQVAVLVYPPRLPVGAPCDLSHRPMIRARPNGEIIDITPSTQPDVAGDEDDRAA